MKKHIPAPRRNQNRQLTYCGEPYEGTISPYDARNAVLLAATGGLLRLYCPMCLAKALASAFRAISDGERGARAVQATRTLQERRDLGTRAANARWSQRRAVLGLSPTDPEPMRLRMAPDTEQDEVGVVGGTAAPAAQDPLMDMADGPLGDPRIASR